jgi:hypothetical protein
VWLPLSYGDSRAGSTMSLRGSIYVHASVKYGYINFKILKDNKDSIDAIGTIITSTILVIGAIASYYRFFRGRTFSVKADLSIDVTIHESGNESYIHSIKIELANLGAFPIWNVEVAIEAYNHIDNGKLSLINVELWKPEHKSINENETVDVIYSGEKSQYIAFNKVSKNIKVVTYFARVKSKKNAIWSKVITVSNLIGESKSARSNK